MEAFVNIVILSQILFIMHSVVFLGNCPIVFHHIDGLEVLPDRGTWTTLSGKTANRWLWRWRRSRIWGNLPKITLKYFTITENISVYVTISLMREKQKKNDACLQEIQPKKFVRQIQYKYRLKEVG